MQDLRVVEAMRSVPRHEFVPSGLAEFYEAQLPRQFDAYVWFEDTVAVSTLETIESAGMPETYPFGV